MQTFQIKIGDVQNQNLERRELKILTSRRRKKTKLSARRPLAPARGMASARVRNAGSRQLQLYIKILLFYMTVVYVCVLHVRHLARHSGELVPRNHTAHALQSELRKLQRPH